MKRLCNTLIAMLLLGQTLINAQQIPLSIDFFKKGITISPYLYGIFFEDLNYAADGGLYAELIRNRSFEESTTYWSMVKGGLGTKSSIAIDTKNLLNSAQKSCLKLLVDSIDPSGFVRIQNQGFWGINVVNKTEYNFSFYAKANAGFEGAITISLTNTSGTTKYAQQKIAGLSTEWKKYTCTLVASGNDPAGVLSLSMNTKGTVWFDVVSLFPPTFNNRPNGLRKDLVQKLKDMQPKFMRFPGGCFVEGADMATGAFRWKQTIGPIEERPGHPNIWKYRTSDGMGYHEFLQLCEDLGTEPMYVCNAGMSHGGDIALANLNPWVQDAIHAIEYANGPTTSTWGHMRELNGHPEPFNMKFIEIGNENWYEPYTSHYNMFYDSIKTYYPDIVTISNVDWASLKNVEIYDDHHYHTTEWFAQNSNFYDSKDRKGPKVYIGEYAVAQGSYAGNGKLRNAVGEAAFMTGMEKNSDIVVMGSYAPLFGNVNACQWNPNAIYFNSSSSYGTPSYYVQQMFAANIGNKYIPVKDSLNQLFPTYNGAIGVGTWATIAEYDSIRVISETDTIVNQNFNGTATGWSVSGGTWVVSNGLYRQTTTNADCRSTFGNITKSKYTYRLKARKASGAEGFLILFANTSNTNFYWWNIGGWGNTQSGVENSRSLASNLVPCVISSNRWYDIRIEVDNGIVKCYLDNVLYHTITDSYKYLYTACTIDTVTDDIYLKVVNFSSIDKTGDLIMTGLPANTSLEGTLQSITYSAPLEENTINLPNKIVPTTTHFTSASAGFTHTFPQNSVNVFHLYPQSSVLHLNNSAFSIPENSANGTVVGSVVATSNAKLKFSIRSSSVDGVFEINDSTGEIHVKNSSLLNFEVNQSISLIISVKDTANNTTRGTCVINLTDVNEKPELVTNKYYAFLKDARGSIGSVFIQDEDNGQNFTYSIKTQAEGNVLSINDSTGELSVGDSTVLSALISKSITFTVSVSDNGTPSLGDEKEYTLEILGKQVNTSIKPAVLQINLEIYPNPAGNFLTVKTAGSIENMIISIIDSKGKKVCNQKISSNEYTISTSMLPNGIYFLQVISFGQIVDSRKIEIFK